MQRAGDHSLSDSYLLTGWSLFLMGCGGQERITRCCNIREHEGSAMVPLSVDGRITMRPRTDKDACLLCNVLYKDERKILQM